MLKGMGKAVGTATGVTDPTGKPNWGGIADTAATGAMHASGIGAAAPALKAMHQQGFLNYVKHNFDPTKIHQPEWWEQMYSAWNNSPGWFKALMITGGALGAYGLASSFTGGGSPAGAAVAGGLGAAGGLAAHAYKDDINKMVGSYMQSQSPVADAMGWMGSRLSGAAVPNVTPAARFSTGSGTAPVLTTQ